MSAKSVLAQPMTIGGLTIKNRFVRSATAERLAKKDGSIDEKMVDLYRTLAEGGTGLIITGHSFVRLDGKANARMSGIDTDDKIPQWRKVTDAVHVADAKIAIQINHAGRQTTEATIGEQPKAPSPVPMEATGTTPRELTHDEILGIIAAYGQAARRAKEAGFDAIQLHGAHGYLISQFNSPYLNCRTDEWGGSPEKRMRFVLAVYDAVRKAVGEGFPIFIKINCQDCVEGGLEPAESSRIAAALVAKGLCAVEISGGTGDVWNEIIRTDVLPGKNEAYFEPHVKPFREAVNVPLMLVGGMRSPSVMQRIVADGVADFVSLCRPLIREPDLPAKILAGRTEPAKCISCNKCFATRACIQEKRASDAKQP
ncbi:MAG: NADH:flavin oxidoreductase [Planctomycetota bacterium]